VEFAPVISTEPASQAVATSSQITLTAAANSNPVATVQWFKSTDHGLHFNPILGATSTTLTDTALSSPGLLEYYAVFTNTLLDGRQHTAGTQVAVVKVDAPPVVILSPISQTISAGQQVTFTANATGTALRVQWQVSTDGGKTFQNIPLANLDTLTFTARHIQNGDEFQAVFTNPVGQVFTSAATLTVT
jgi:hypothetical protein